MRCDLAEWLERLTAIAVVATVWVRFQHSPTQLNLRESTEEKNKKYKKGSLKENVLCTKANKTNKANNTQFRTMENETPQAQSTV
jgi:hypothetical protein